MCTFRAEQRLLIRRSLTPFRVWPQLTTFLSDSVVGAYFQLGKIDLLSHDPRVRSVDIVHNAFPVD